MLDNLFLFAFVAVFGSGDAGTTAFPLLRVTTSPRACAMGEAFTGFADDVGAVFWNPAGLGRLSTVQLGLSHHEWFGGVRDEQVSLAAPVGPGTFGAAAVFSTTEGIELWDPLNQRSQPVAARSGYATVGYGASITPSLDCGISFKALYDDLIEQTGTGVCADVGLLFQAARPVRVGLVGQNLGWGMSYGSDNVPLPMVLRLGASLVRPRFAVVLDASAPIDSRPNLHLGGEYLISHILALRAGYRTGPQDLATLSPIAGITCGLGINLSPLSLDYAFVPYGELGMTHRVALRASFRTRLYGTVRIRVVEFKSGAPLVAQFKLEGVQQGNSYTESDGTFVVEGVEPGWLKVTATTPGYNQAVDSVLVEPRVTHTVRLVVRRAGFGSLWGVVYDSLSRIPVRSQVSYSGPEEGTVTTGERDGSFLLRKLSAGEYDITVVPTDSAYQRQILTVTIEPGELLSRTFLLGRRGGSQETETRPVEPESIPAAQPGEIGTGAVNGTTVPAPEPEAETEEK